MIASTHPAPLSDAALSACAPDRNSAIFLPFADYFCATTLVTGDSESRTRQNTCYKSLAINNLVTKVSGNPCTLVTDHEENKEVAQR